MIVDIMTLYDPDSGYWDPETDTWFPYDDMELI